MSLIQQPCTLRYVLLARFMPSWMACSKPSGWTELSSVTRATVIVSLYGSTSFLEIGLARCFIFDLPTALGKLNAKKKRGAAAGMHKGPELRMSDPGPLD
jgi:hypothetical protein